MPYGRQLRLDRRRRVLRDNIIRNSPETVTPKPSARSSRAERPNTPTPTSSSVTLVGYSQEVRGPCQQRLVHFIPVRPSTLATVVAGICLAIGALVGLHYAVWIAGPDSWRSTPLSLLLDVRSRVGLAGWINVQLWLITAILCGMTFQIRKHRLDDYRAHYRVWLWLALASLLASIEAGTGLTQVLAASMERFGRLNFGWSGRTLVEISIATAVGMLALRICSELRASPVSQVLWLIGLVCWVPSALLASQLIKTTLRPDYAHLYIGALWLIGKTFVMLAAMIYLRQVYIAAQRRFVERSRLAPANWKLAWPKLRRESEEDTGEEEEQTAKPRKNSRRKKIDDSELENEAETEADSETGDTPTKRRLRLPSIRWSEFSKWVAAKVPKVRLPKVKLKRSKRQATDDDADDTATSISNTPPKTAKAAPPKKQTSESEPSEPKPKRRWRIPRPNLGSLFAFRKWIRLPKLSSLNPLSRMRLKPPAPDAETDSSAKNKNTSNSATAANSNRSNGPLPSTSPSPRPSTQPAQARPNQAAPLSQANRNSSQHDEDDDEDDDNDNQDRKLSKAERKRLKRMQQEQRRNAA